jgi:hypothetical protein
MSHIFFASFLTPTPFLHTCPQPYCSGADVWHQWPGGRWDADEQYEGQIGFEWDRSALHRSLTKIISQPVENNRRLPRLKVSLWEVQAEGDGDRAGQGNPLPTCAHTLTLALPGLGDNTSNHCFDASPCFPTFRPAGAAVWCG